MVSSITVKDEGYKSLMSLPGILYVNVWQLVSMNVKRDLKINAIIGLKNFKNNFFFV